MDPPRTCSCGYCTDSRVREFIDGGLQAARDGGHPKPHARVIYNVYFVPEFGASRACYSTLKNWLACCTLWTDPWPGQPDG